MNLAVDVVDKSKARAHNKSNQAFLTGSKDPFATSIKLFGKRDFCVFAVFCKHVQMKTNVRRKDGLLVFIYFVCLFVFFCFYPGACLFHI